MVQIIKKFFADKNLSLVSSFITKTDLNSWVCEMVLKYNNFEIYRALGTGSSEEDAILKAHLQIYMMFCHKLRFMDNLVISKKYIQQSTLEKGYGLHKNEKNISYEELMELPIIYNFFNRVFGSNETYTRQVFNILTDDFYIGEPFVQEDQIIYCDPRILSRVIGATGVGVGVTKEEAIENGIYSFLLEEMKMQLAKSPAEKYDYIALSAVASETNKQYLKQAEVEGYKVKIIDFSSAYCYPVIGLIVFNPHNLNYHFTFGCNVDFEKALSQAFEELFINTNSLNTDNRFFIPYRDLSVFDLFFTPNVCNEIFLNNDIENPSFNNEFFSSEYLNKIKSTFSIKIVDGPIPTVQAVNFNSHFCLGYFADDNICASMGNLIKKDNIVYLMRLKKQAELIFSDKELSNLDDDLYYRQIVLTDDTAYTWYDGNFIGHFERLDWLNPMPTTNIITTELTNFHFLNTDNIGLFSETPARDAVKYFMSLQNICMMGHYNTTEIKNFFKNAFNIDVLDEHFTGISNAQYLFKHMFVLPMHNYYNSEEYKNFISSFII